MIFKKIVFNCFRLFAIYLSLPFPLLPFASSMPLFLVRFLVFALLLYAISLLALCVFAACLITLRRHSTFFFDLGAYCLFVTALCLLLFAFKPGRYKTTYRKPRGSATEGRGKADRAQLQERSLGRVSRPNFLLKLIFERPTVR